MAKTKGKNKKEKASKTQEVVKKSKTRQGAREKAWKKMAAAKIKAKERFKKSKLKVKETMEKKRLAKIAKAKEIAKKKANQPKTSEGWVQRAAEHRYDAYKKQMAASKLQKLYAKKKATKVAVA